MQSTTVVRLGIVLHAFFAAATLAWSLWGAYTFWQNYFGSPLASVGAVLVIEFIALAGFLCRVFRIPSLLQHFRHVLPFISVGFVIHSIHDMIALRQSASEWLSWTVTILFAILLTIFSFATWISLERLLTRAEQIVKNRNYDHALRFIEDAQTNLAFLADISRIVSTLPPPTSDSPSDSGHRYTCPSCHAPLTQQQYAAALRHGRCRNCRPLSNYRRNGVNVSGHESLAIVADRESE